MHGSLWRQIENPVVSVELIGREIFGAQIAEALAKPRDTEEEARLWLRDNVFADVEAFYDGYIQATTKRDPFYYSSSRS